MPLAGPCHAMAMPRGTRATTPTKAKEASGSKATARRGEAAASASASKASSGTPQSEAGKRRPPQSPRVSSSGYGQSPRRTVGSTASPGRPTTSRRVPGSGSSPVRESKVDAGLKRSGVKPRTAPLEPLLASVAPAVTTPAEAAAAASAVATAVATAVAAAASARRGRPAEAMALQGNLAAMAALAKEASSAAEAAEPAADARRSFEAVLVEPVADARRTPEPVISAAVPATLAPSDRDDEYVGLPSQATSNSDVMNAGCINLSEAASTQEEVPEPVLCKEEAEGIERAAGALSVVNEALCKENARLREEVERQRQQLELLAGREAPTQSSISGRALASSGSEEQATGATPAASITTSFVTMGSPAPLTPTPAQEWPPAAKAEAAEWDPRMKVVPRVLAPKSDASYTPNGGGNQIALTPAIVVAAGALATQVAGTHKMKAGLIETVAGVASGAYTPRPGDGRPAASGTYTPRASLLSPRPSVALRSGVHSVPLPSSAVGPRFVPQGDSAFVPQTRNGPGMLIAPPSAAATRVVSLAVAMPATRASSPEPTGVQTPRFTDRPLSPTHWSAFPSTGSARFQAATVVQQEVCTCGNAFASDAAFCRFCGTRRPAGSLAGSVRAPTTITAAGGAPATIHGSTASAPMRLGRPVQPMTLGTVSGIPSVQPMPMGTASGIACYQRALSPGVLQSTQAVNTAQVSRLRSATPERMVSPALRLGDPLGMTVAARSMRA